MKGRIKVLSPPATAVAVGVLFFSGMGCDQGTRSSDPSKSSRQRADVVYTNGKIYTVDRAHPLVDAVAVKDGRFLAVGSGRDIQGFVGERTRVVDLGGAFAMPGFIDGHIHPRSPISSKRAVLSSSLRVTARSRSLKRLPRTWRRTRMRHTSSARSGDRVVSERARQQRVAGLHGQRPSGDTARRNTSWRGCQYGDAEARGHHQRHAATQVWVHRKGPPDRRADRVSCRNRHAGCLQQVTDVPGRGMERALKRAMQKLTAWGVTGFNDMSANAPQFRAYRRMERAGSLHFHVSGSVP